MSLRDQLQESLGNTYTIQRELTGGGMSRVFLAEERALERPVVIKVLSPDKFAGLSVDRFRREIRLAASLQQANVVPVLSAGEMAGLPYYSMPFVEGESLRVRLSNRGALPVRETINVLRDVARALAYAHQRRVVHRDIKPENILLSGNTAVVTDFGIAKAVEAARVVPDSATLTGPGLAVGTPAYISPEQASGDSNIDHRADIYSLGVVAYELLTGAPPFKGRSGQALLAAHIVERPVDLSERRRDLPRELTTLVMSCLEKDPALRPQSAAAVLETLEAAAPDDFGLLGEPAMEAAPTIAVLPFSNLSGSNDDDYFSDGMTEDIISQLSQISSLRVISRTSVMRYKRTEKSTREIADELGVSNIVEGSVRRAGNRMRIVAQLIDPATGTHLWAESFDREMTDVFAIQSEVAERVAGVLRKRVSPDEKRRAAKRPTDDVEAYNLFLLGRQQYHAITVDIGGFAKAGEFFQRAIDRDPNFGRAYAWLAMVQVYFGGGYWGVKPRDAWAGGLSLAAKALELDGDIAEAHVALGQHADWIQYDWETARHHKETALRLSPNDTTAVIPYALLLAELGRWDEMVAATHRAVALDPASIVVRVNAIFICWGSGAFDEAHVHVRAARTWFANDPGLPVWEAAVLVGLGRKTEALPLVRSAIEAPLDNLHGLLALAVLAACGDTATATARLAAFHAREATEYVWPFGFAMCYSQLGDSERAIGYLERAYEDRTGWVSLLATAPLFEPLRGDPRFDRILGWVNPPAARVLAAS